MVYQNEKIRISLKEGNVNFSVDTVSDMLVGKIYPVSSRLSEPKLEVLSDWKSPSLELMQTVYNRSFLKRRSHRLQNRKLT